MSGRKSIFYMVGYRIGYWFAGNRDFLIRRALGMLPGFRWISRFLR